MKYKLPSDFLIGFKKIGFLTYQLKTSMTIPVPQKKAFEFFKDPSNLFEITPDWLDFRMRECQEKEVYEGAEYEYTIKVFGLKLFWKSRIVHYKPPERFIDIQLKGPYKMWSHLHTFDSIPEGTFLNDIVTYQPPVYALPFHFIIKRQLTDIFSYRAVRIKEWSIGNFKRKGIGNNNLKTNSIFQ